MRTPPTWAVYSGTVQTADGRTFTCFGRTARLTGGGAAAGAAAPAASSVASATGELDATLSVQFIWALGADDALRRHTSEGAFALVLADPQVSPQAVCACVWRRRNGALPVPAGRVSKEAAWAPAGGAGPRCRRLRTWGQPESLLLRAPSGLLRPMSVGGRLTDEAALALCLRVRAGAHHDRDARRAHAVGDDPRRLPAGGVGRPRAAGHGPGAPQVRRRVEMFGVGGAAWRAAHASLPPSPEAAQRMDVGAHAP